MRQRKYILIRNKNGETELRFGYPIYHRDLLNRNEHPNDCLGGGKWCIDDADMSIILYGSSDDFGTPQRQDLEKAIKDFDNWEYFEWICRNIYKTEIHLNRVIKIQ